MIRFSCRVSAVSFTSRTAIPQIELPSKVCVAKGRAVEVRLAAIYSGEIRLAEIGSRQDCPA
jgi:hypothetical protein